MLRSAAEGCLYNARLWTGCFIVIVFSAMFISVKVCQNSILFALELIYILPVAILCQSCLFVEPFGIADSWI